MHWLYCSFPEHHQSIHSILPAVSPRSGLCVTFNYVISPIRGKCGLSSEMRPTCGPFNQFGPHADQIRSCGPLWKHCLFHPPSAFRKLIRFSIGESIYILYIFQRAQQTLGDLNKMIFDGPSIRNTWQKIQIYFLQYGQKELPSCFWQTKFSLHCIFLAPLLGQLSVPGSK